MSAARHRIDVHSWKPLAETLERTIGSARDEKPFTTRGDSFFDRGLSAPSYTRPPEYRGHAVPDVLLSGAHQRIAEWRAREGERLTRERGAGEDSGTLGNTGC